MKYFYMFLAFISLISGCNNWADNQVNDPVEENNSPGLIYKMDYPGKASALSFLGDGSMLIGTHDGKFYKSNDNGKTWSLCGTMKVPGTVNTFLYFEEGFGSTLKKYLMAGTKKGIYVSYDMGDSWQESLTEISSLGEYPEIYCFYKDFDPFLNQNMILAFGGDGENNRFVTVDQGKSWKKSNLSNIYKSKIISLITWEVISSNRVYLNVLFGTADSVKPLIIHARYLLAQTQTITGFYFKPNENVNCIYKGQNNIYSCGTNNGIYGGNLDRDVWEKINLEGYSVISLIQTVDGMYFAGTNKGWWFSKDGGKNWIELNTGAIKETVTKQILNKNKIFLITEPGGVYSTDIPKKIDATVYLPVLSSPENGAVKVSSSPVFSWYNWRNPPSTYSLQISRDSSFSDPSTETIDYINSLSYQVNNLISGTKYYWRLKAYNLFGLTTWSKYRSFTVE